MQPVCDYFNMGQLVAEPIVISIGRSNELWRLQTEQGFFALKKIPEKSAFIESEKIAVQFSRRGIVTTRAYGYPDHMAFADSGYIYFLFDWLDGDKIKPVDVTVEQAAIMGSVLASLHACRLSTNATALNNEFYDFKFDQAQWEKLIDQAIAAGIDQTDLWQRLLPQLIKTTADSMAAHQQLQEQCIISHRDSSPNNVIWLGDHHPVIIDWELAGFTHPTVELIGTAFDWSIITPEHIDQPRFKAVIEGYQHSGGVIDIDKAPMAFAALMGIWFAWMVFNLRRFIDPPSRQARETAEQQALRTLQAFTKVWAGREQWIAT